MSLRWLVALPLLCTFSCTAPRISAAPPFAPRSEAVQAPTLDVCVLVHQHYDTDKSNAIAGGDGQVAMEFATIVVRHPTKGTLLIDPSIGKEKQKDFAENPWPMRRVIGDGSKAVALGELLTQASIPPESIQLAVITHMHWDHICGATDVPNATIMARDPELAWADKASGIFGRAVPPHEIERIRNRIKLFKPESGPYEGFSASYDLFGDGSIVGVPTPGHTPGSTSWFVNSGDGRRWLFIGDAAWNLEGVQTPVHKGWTGRFADDDKHSTGESLAVLHQFAKARPVKSPPDGIGVQVVPAHDPTALSTIPRCTN